MTTTTADGVRGAATPPDAAETVRRPRPAGSRPAKLLRTYGPLLAIGVLALVLLVWAPGSLTTFRLGNLGKYCCWAHRRASASASPGVVAACS